MRLRGIPIYEVKDSIVRVPLREPTEQDCIGDGKDRRIDPHRQRESRNRRAREAAIAHQCSGSEAEIGDEVHAGASYKER